MSQSLRVLVFNADEAYSAELRFFLMRIAGVKIVGEIGDASLIPQGIAQFPVDVLVAHLDPDIDYVLEIIRQCRESNPALAVVAVSESTDGAVVLRAMRAGIREFLVKPLSDEELQRALAKFERGDAAAREPAKVISVIGCAGGVGASTLAVNLAVELSQLIAQPGRVALVDLDFRFGQVATMLDVHPQYSIADLCDSPENIDPQMVEKVLVQHAAGVRVLARPGNFVQADSITAAHCASVLAVLADMCDYIVIDGPTRYDQAAQTVIDSADYNLLVAQLLVTNVRNADRVYRELAQHGFNLDRVHLVCNRVGIDARFLDVGQVEKTIGRPMFATIPDDWAAVSTAINMGEPLCWHSPRGRARRAIAAIAQRIHNPAATLESPPPQRGGLVGRLLATMRSGRSAGGPVAATTT